MSDMDDDDDYFDDDDDGMDDDDGDVDDDDAFEGPPPLRAEESFQVLSSEQCLAQAQKEISDTVDLLCCDNNVAEMLLRQYKWDRHKLAEGA